MPVMRIDGRMHHARVPLSYIGPVAAQVRVLKQGVCTLQRGTPWSKGSGSYVILDRLGA